MIGLFVAVRAVESLGITAAASAALGRIPRGSPLMLLGAASLTAAASNIANNLPAALLMRSILQAGHASTGVVLAALVGADVGPLVTLSRRSRRCWSWRSRVARGSRSACAASSC